LFDNLKGKKLLLAPATPLTISFAQKLKNSDIEVVGFLDKNKTGDKIYRYNKIKDLDYDYILIYNEQFFWSIYAEIVKNANKKRVYRVVKKSNDYELFDNKRIKKEKLKKIKKDFKIKLFEKIQKYFAIIIDLLKIKRDLTVVLTKDFIGGNAKYLYLFLKKDGKRVELISNTDLAEKLEKKYVPFYSLKSYIKIAIAKNIIVDEMIYEYFNNTTVTQNKIQLWHGVGIKKLNPVKNLKFDYFISTSNWTNETNFKNIFNADKFLNYGYPRNDLFFRETLKDDLVLCDEWIYKLSENKKTIVYMPTYRDILEDNIPPLDFDYLDEVFGKIGIVFIMKLHPFVKELIQSRYKNIIFYPSKYDIYPVLKNTDILITDYSSVLYDYLLLDKPIISFVYDKEKYVTTRNGFLFDYDEYTPAKQVFNQDELIKEINYILEGNDDFGEKRKEIMNKFFDYIDGKSCKRIKEIL